ncbi:MAG: glycosyltransferase family 4 protein [Candidatus Thiodiazotropha sp. (ex Lucinoma kastoroae)]|nr:glycosyltransferase family 4 protein [Candidatus Thiodiazotropha sp. (ex Lucinoma kastoroae)]MCU7862243.1 glycosyltransferase family 4 protein [Candidatus Thiodiazotropha sp. (ex Lucinoma kastoroae)]
MKILLLTRYTRMGASSRLRSYQYLPFLKNSGIDVTVSPLFSDAYLKAFYGAGSKSPSLVLKAYWKRLKQLIQIQKFDLLWIEYEIFPWLPATFEQMIKRRGIPYTVDYDDAIFHRYDHASSTLIRYILGKKIDHVMRHSALVTAGNSYLVARAKVAGANHVMQLPTVVDTSRYRCKNATDNAYFTVGWIGSPTTAPYLELLRSPLQKLANVLPLRLLTIGGAIDAIPGVKMMSLTWSEANETEKLQQFDVGVMPLHDDLWERGKCGYKLIQYMACGLPVVASPVGVNTQLVEHGVTGFHADTEDAWIAALTQLSNDLQLRSEMGLKGRIKVENDYSLSVMAPKLVNALMGVTGKHR